MTAVRFRQLLAVVARASDVGMGMPDDHGARVGIVAHGLATAAGLTPRQARDAVFSGMLRFAGCTAESHSAAAILGDEISARGAMYGQAHFAEPREFMSFLWRYVGSDGRALPSRVARFARMMAKTPKLFESAIAHCEVNEQVARRLGLDEDTRLALRHTFEVWNGGGMPRKLKGEAIVAPARVVIAADEIEIAHRMSGVEGATALLRRRSGRAVEPRLCEVFAAHAAAICAPLEGPSSMAALDALPLVDEPAGDGAAIDATCEVLADLSDLKCQHTAGHSQAVAALAVQAAGLLRVPPDVRVHLRRAALLHDVGRVGISATVWDKPGPLAETELERARTHTLLTERILAASPALAAEAELAALAHERLDGRGYHRRLPPAALGAAARVLAAADVFQALRSDRAWRPALATSRAVEQVREEARAGRLDGEAVEAVLAAAGERPAPQATAPAGLTAREVEVLRLLARGLTNKQIAAALNVTVKTAGNHVQNTLGKLDVRTRSAAVMFAMRHGLAS